MEWLLLGCGNYNEVILKIEMNGLIIQIGLIPNLYMIY